MAKSKNPPGPIRRAQKYAEFKTDGAIARALLATFADNSWTLSERSLAAKVGELDRGKLVWWANNPDKAECLGKLLDVPLADFGLHGPAINSHVFGFDDFPELPPLDLKREKPWVLGDAYLDSSQKSSMGFGRETLEDWFKPALWTGRPPYNKDWLYMADDMERQLLSKALAAAGNFEVVFVEELSDARSRLQSPKPLIVSVRADGGDEDLAALALRPDHAGTLVIASYMLPVRKATSSVEYLGWEQRTTSGLERNSFQLTAPGPMGDLNRWTWRLFPDWRSQLLKWVEAYVHRHGIDSSFSDQRIGNWLDRFDPRGQWFCTATDVMQLCRMGHYRGKKLPAPTDPFAGNSLVQSLFKTESPARSLQIKQLAVARWKRRELPWQGDLPLEAWLSLAQSSAALVARDDLASIAQGKTEPERKRAADRVANLLEAGNPDILLASGLLKQGQYGSFDFQHRTLAGLVVRDCLMQQITSWPLASWALDCFDNERRPLVDAALDALTVANLVDTADRLHQEAPDSAVVIAASEALFMAVARRIAQGESIPASLMSVAQCVLKRLDLAVVDWALPEPWSRPIEGQDAQLEWISACWAWSLLPNAPASMAGNWLFPGWCESLAEPPDWLINLWPDKECEQLSFAWDDFFSVIDQWVKDLEQPVVDAPRILRMAMLGKAARGTWLAESAWWHGVIEWESREWADAFLLKQLKLGGAGVAVRLWPSFLMFERTVPAEGLGAGVFRLGRVRRWLLEQLSPTDALNALEKPSLLYLAGVPESLPPTFRAPLLQLLAKDSLKIGYTDALNFFTRFGPSAAQALAGYLDHDTLGYAAAKCFWDWEPENAARLLSNRNELSTVGLRHLIYACPESHVAVATEVLLAEPTLFEVTERMSWARKHLPNAGREAERLVAIIATVPSNCL